MAPESNFNLEHFETIRRLTCRIVTPDQKGSGVILLPADDSTRLYVLTAKHCLLGNDFDRPTAPEDITVDFSPASAKGDKGPGTPYRLESAAHIICYETSDIAVISLEQAKVKTITGEIPRIHVLTHRRDSLPSLFSGFPQAYDNKKRINIHAYYTDLNTVAPSRVKLDTLESEALFNCKGFSGGGVFSLRDNQLVLGGIVLEFGAFGQRFHVLDLSLLNPLLEKNSLPGITTAPVEHTQEEAAEDGKRAEKKAYLKHMCDRGHESSSIYRFLEETLERRRKLPAFFFIRGEKSDCHKGFEIRLMLNEIKRFSKNKLDFPSIKPEPEYVNWPRRGTLEERKSELILNLTKKFMDCPDPHISATGFSGKPCFDKTKLCTIRHDIHTSSWDAGTRPLIRWYIQDFWGNLEADGSIPLFLVFLNIIYEKEPEQGGWWPKIFKSQRGYARKEVDEELKTCRSGSTHCPCLLLDELPDVDRDSVDEWNEVHGVCDDTEACIQWLDGIFNQEELLPMSRIEKELDKMVRKHVKEEPGNE